LLIGLQK